MMNFVFKTRNVALKTRNSVLTMIQNADARGARCGLQSTELWRHPQRAPALKGKGWGLLEIEIQSESQRQGQGESQAEGSGGWEESVRGEEGPGPGRGEPVIAVRKRQRESTQLLLRRPPARAPAHPDSQGSAPPQLDPTGGLPLTASLCAHQVLDQSSGGVKRKTRCDLPPFPVQSGLSSRRCLD